MPLRIRIALLAAVAILVTAGAYAQPCGQPPYDICAPWGQEVYYYSDAAKTNLVGYEYSGCPDICSCEWDQAYSWGNLGAPYFTQYCFQCNGCGQFCVGDICPMSNAPVLKKFPGEPPRPFPRISKPVIGAQRCLLP